MYKKVEPTERVCGYCKEKFIAVGLKRYCSDACAKKKQTEQLMKWKAENREHVREQTNLRYKSKAKEVKKIKIGFVSHLDDKLRYAAAKGIGYGELQRQETIRKYGRVEI